MPSSVHVRKAAWIARALVLAGAGEARGEEAQAALLRLGSEPPPSELVAFYSEVPSRGAYESLENNYCVPVSPR